VQILDQQHSRALRRPFPERRHRTQQVAADILGAQSARPLSEGGGVQPEEMLQRRLDLFHCGREETLQRRGELLPRISRRVEFADFQVDPQEFQDDAVADALGEFVAAPDEEPDAGTEAVPEFRGEPGLAEPGLPDEKDDPSLPRAESLPGGQQVGKFPLPVHQRRSEPGARGLRPGKKPA